jgi:methionyl-tRNA formyltransferase
MSLVFFGASSFAIPIFEKLIQEKWEIVALVTQPDKPTGRGLKITGSPLKIKAQELGLKILQPKSLKTPEISKEIKNLKADLGIVAAYGNIIPKSILDVFPLGILNLHPSLLPKYRGPSPIQATILNGDKETGITIILLDEEMDHGPIIAVAKYQIQKPITAKELLETLSKIGADLLVKTLPKWKEGQIVPYPQDDTQATYTKLLTKEDGKINWNQPAAYLERMVRAYDPWPGTWSVWNNKRIKIIKVSLLDNLKGAPDNSTPGYVWLTNQKKIAVNCQPGSLLIEQLQLEGKRILTSEEFIHGYQSLIGSILR